MLLSLIVSAVMTIPPSPPDAQHICRDARQMKDVNLPPVSTSAATDVEHVALVYSGERFAGVIYVTQEGDMWYQVGTPKAAVDEGVGRAVVSALGFRNQYRQQTFYRIQPIALRELVTNGNSVLSCY